MKKPITIGRLEDLLDSIFDMGFGKGLKRNADKPLEMWYIGYFLGDITIPIALYCDRDEVKIQLLRIENSEMDKDMLIGYVLGALSQIAPDLKFRKEEEQNWFSFYFNGDDSYGSI